MSETVPHPDEPGDVTDLPASFVLGDSGWETTDYVEPGPDWRLAEDGMYESPDGTVRTKPIGEPAEWSDRLSPDEG